MNSTRLLDIYHVSIFFVLLTALTPSDLTGSEWPVERSATRSSFFGLLAGPQRQIQRPRCGFYICTPESLYVLHVLFNGFSHHCCFLFLLLLFFFFFFLLLLLFLCSSIIFIFFVFFFVICIFFSRVNNFKSFVFYSFRAHSAV